MLKQAHAEGEWLPQLGRSSKRFQVLVAGACPAERAALRRRLLDTLPRHTPVREAGEVSEILEQAPHSRMVVLAEDLGELSTDTLVHMIGHRHPRLPVVALGAG